MVANCSFDSDAVMLETREAEQLLRDSGFTAVTSRYIVFFPKTVAWLRWMDGVLGWIPLGAQFLAVGQKN